MLSMIDYYRDLLKKLAYSPQNRAEIYYRIGIIYFELAKFSKTFDLAKESNINLGLGQRNLGSLDINSNLGLPNVQPPSDIGERDLSTVKVNPNLGLPDV